MPCDTFGYEYTDTFAGEANYAWVRRGTVTAPELTHYGYDGSRGYAKANKAQGIQVVRKVKAELGLTGTRGKGYWRGDTYEFRPYGMNTVLFIDYCEPGQ